MLHRAEHDRLTFHHPLPEGFDQAALEAHLAQGRLLHAKAVRHGFATGWQSLLHLFDFRLGLSQSPKTDHA